MTRKRTPEASLRWAVLHKKIWQDLELCRTHGVPIARFRDTDVIEAWKTVDAFRRDVLANPDYAGCRVGENEGGGTVDVVFPVQGKKNDDE